MTWLGVAKQMLTFWFPFHPSLRKKRNLFYFQKERERKKNFCLLSNLSTSLLNCSLGFDVNLLHYGDELCQWRGKKNDGARERLCMDAWDARPPTIFPRGNGNKYAEKWGDCHFVVFFIVLVWPFNEGDRIVSRIGSEDVTIGRGGLES